jgi:hypothetical protein
MFIKPITIPDKKTGKRYNYFRLCESYRIGDSPRHRTILNVGKLEELPDKKDHKILADAIEQLVYRKETLIELPVSPTIKKLAEHFARIIINNKLVDIIPDAKKATSVTGKVNDDHQLIDVNSIRHELVRETGSEWLCKQTLDRLGLADCLKRLQWEPRWIKLAMIYLIGRAVFPASELKTEDWLGRNTSLAELYDLNPGSITRHHLYKVSRMLYEAKDKIENYLSSRTSELFEIDDKIVLYDLTNTYFEGQKKSSTKAKFGKSKEKRNDAKLFALALVVNAAGFVKYSKLYEGNIRDSATLQCTLEEMPQSDSKGRTKKVVVMDAGFATEENLKMLREKQYDYVCVSLAKMKDYKSLNPGKKPVELIGKQGHKISVRWVEAEGKQDRILYVKSELKKLKEASMEELFCKRYEEGLVAIKKGIEKKSGVKKADKVHERLGRLKQKYPSVHRYYKVNTTTRKGVVKTMEWKKIADGESEQGVYFVRTTLDGNDEKTLWQIYNTIREIESTFRILKSDLKMRPVFHQKDIYSESHIFGSITAYTIVHSIRYPLKAHGVHLDWSNIVRTMNTQKVITTTMKTKTGAIIRLKKCSEPEADVREICRMLKYKDRPFWQKKSVLPKNENQKMQIPDTG